MTSTGVRGEGHFQHGGAQGHRKIGGLQFELKVADGGGTGGKNQVMGLCLFPGR